MKKVFSTTVAIAFLCASARADFKGQHWIDKKFETYGVKKIALQVIGTWRGTAAKVEPSKIAEALSEKLREKGYEVVVKKGKPEKDEEPADAMLVVRYQSMSVGSLGPVQDEGGRGEELRDYNVTGNVQLTLTKGRKVIFKATGGTASQFKEKGPQDGYGRVIEIGDPVIEFCKIVDPLPAHPDAKKDLEEEKATEKKERGGREEGKRDN